jgi:hypothetical protein
MYTLSAAQQANFLSTDFMAVSTNTTVRSAATDGAINIVKLNLLVQDLQNIWYNKFCYSIRGDGSSGVYQ